MNANWLSLSVVLASLMFPILSNGVTVSFDALTRDSIASLTIQDTILNGSDNANNQISTGTVLVYRTRNGYLGKLCGNPPKRTMAAGYHQLQWTSAKGVYIARMDVNGRSFTTRMVTVR